MLLSVIVPCYNEIEVLHTTHQRLSTVLRTINDFEFEIIYVDDGSADQTGAMLAELQQRDVLVRVIRLSRNFGHQIALTAGLERAAGDAVVIIDADLQDPPEVIPEMVERWRSGFQVVYGTRTDREGESKFKLWTAKLFYRFINFLSDTRIPVDTGDFRLLDREVVTVLLTMPEQGRFLRGMVSWAGFRQISVPYRRQSRHSGKSKYSLFKMIRFAIDGIMSFSVVPLKLATWIGLLLMCLALGTAIIAVLVRLLGGYALRLNLGWLVLVTVLLIGGIQLLCIGIIGGYVGRIYSEVKRRPLYVVQELLGFENQNRERGATRDQAEVNAYSQGFS